MRKSPMPGCEEARRKTFLSNGCLCRCFVTIGRSLAAFDATHFFRRLSPTGAHVPLCQGVAGIKHYRGFLMVASGNFV
jgi:hypothetical protein